MNQSEAETRYAEALKGLARARTMSAMAGFMAWYTENAEKVQECAARLTGTDEANMIRSILEEGMLNVTTYKEIGEEHEKSEKDALWEGAE
jgi:hypothetical protein